MKYKMTLSHYKTNTQNKNYKINRNKKNFYLTKIYKIWILIKYVILKTLKLVKKNKDKMLDNN